jgi:hypothetical protein
VGHRRDPPVFIKAGDLLEVQVSPIGVLRNRVVDEAGWGDLRQRLRRHCRQRSGRQKERRPRSAISRA